MGILPYFILHVPFGCSPSFLGNRRSCNCPHTHTGQQKVTQAQFQDRIFAKTRSWSDILPGPCSHMEGQVWQPVVWFRSRWRPP